MENKATIQNNKAALFHTTNKPSKKIPDLNELMLKYVLDLKPNDKSTKAFPQNQKAISSQNLPLNDLNNNGLILENHDFNTKITNFKDPIKVPSSKLAKTDIDFFCNLNSSFNTDNFNNSNFPNTSFAATTRNIDGNWADFDDYTKHKHQKSIDLTLANLDEENNFFEVWHKYFLALRSLYKNVYDLFTSRQQENNHSQIFAHKNVQDFLECNYLTVLLTN
jgi:hypothetical protein